MPLRKVACASFCYCATCLAAAAGSYLVMWATGNLIESGAAPVANILLLALFFGAMTTLFCLGGLLGVWILAARVRGTMGQHIVGGVLLALLGCGSFLFGASLGEDRLFLRAFEVAAICVGAALLVRLYVASSPGPHPVDLSR